MLNKAVIMGRLTRDPEVRQTQNGISVCSFSVAVNRDMVNKSTGQHGTGFIKVTAWREKADLIGKYFSKGKMIVVEGRIQVSCYTDKDGNKRTDTEIVAENIYFGESKKKDSDSSATSVPASSGASRQSNDTAESAESAESEESEDELPF